MAKGKEIKQWITINGRHVPIYEDGTLGSFADSQKYKGSNQETEDKKKQKKQDEVTKQVADNKDWQDEDELIQDAAGNKLTEEEFNKRYDAEEAKKAQIEALKKRAAEKKDPANKTDEDFMEKAGQEGGSNKSSDEIGTGTSDDRDRRVKEKMKQWMEKNYPGKTKDEIDVGNWIVQHTKFLKEENDKRREMQGGNMDWNKPLQDEARKAETGKSIKVGDKKKGREAADEMSRRGSINYDEATRLPDGSRIQVEQFSSITGKPNGKYEEYIKSNNRWSSKGYGSFDNDVNSMADHLQANSKGVVPTIKVGNKEVAVNKTPDKLGIHETRMQRTKTAIANGQNNLKGMPIGDLRELAIDAGVSGSKIKGMSADELRKMILSIYKKK